jgi:hypothetical protein
VKRFTERTYPRARRGDAERLLFEGSALAAGGRDALRYASRPAEPGRAF